MNFIRGIVLPSLIRGVRAQANIGKILPNISQMISYSNEPTEKNILESVKENMLKVNKQDVVDIDVENDPDYGYTEDDKFAEDEIIDEDQLIAEDELLAQEEKSAKDKITKETTKSQSSETNFGNAKKNI